MKRKDLRKVKFSDLIGDIRNGFFHKWVVIDNRVTALVEDEEGFMHSVLSLKNIKFIEESEE